MNTIHVIVDLEQLKMKNKKAVSIEPNQISNETKVSMKTRIISAAIGIAIVIPCVLFGNIFTIALVAFIMCIAMYELIRCAKQMYRFYLYIIMLIISSLLTFWPFLRNLFEYFQSDSTSYSWRLYTNFDHIYVSIVVLAVTAFVLFFMVVLHSSFTVRDACFIFTMIVLISLGLQSLLYLRFAPMCVYYDKLGNPYSDKFINFFDTFQSATLLLFVALSTSLADAGAYFVGIFFGRNKMNERISPKKTWEGFVGGLLISSIICSAIGVILAACGCPMMEKVFDLNHWFNIVALSLIIPVVSTLGDFVFSSIKRFYDIKDYGKLIPGHGGILDRIDSLIFAAITTAIYVNIASSIVFAENIFL